MKTILALCVLCICVTVCIIALRGTPVAPSVRLWTPLIIEPDGKQTILGDTRQMEFWTPSTKTKDFLHNENGEVITTEKWEVISNDDVLIQFGDVLRTNISVLGYRRVEVLGQGRTGYKPGWWWTVNVLTNYPAEDLGKTYESFWQSHHPVFFEVIDNRGSAE